ncbi:MAG TPA: hypothetical protein VHS59_13360 [Bacillota bacterium]|nr:hypothetical protein [Bacillota bacterium]
MTSLAREAKEGYNRLCLLMYDERGDFIQNAIYIALVVIFGITVIGNFGKAIEGQFEAIITKFQETTPK